MKILLRYLVFREIPPKWRRVLPIAALTAVVAAGGVVAGVVNNYSTETPLRIREDAQHHFWLKVRLTSGPVAVESVCLWDSGASQIAISREIAKKLDLRGLDFSRRRAETANGVVAMARVNIDRIEVGPFTHTYFPVAVIGGAMDGCVLGTTFQNLVHYSVKNGELAITAKGT